MIKEWDFDKIYKIRFQGFQNRQLYICEIFVLNNMLRMYIYLTLTHFEGNFEMEV